MTGRVLTFIKCGGSVERSAAWVQCEVPSVYATFMYETWATAQQADTCIWASCPPPKIWSHARVTAGAAGGRWDMLVGAGWVY